MFEKFYPNPEYYEQIAQSEVSDHTVKIARSIIAPMLAFRHGQSEILMPESVLNLEKGPMYVANHRSNYDPFVLVEALLRNGLKAPRPLAKLELFNFGPMRKFLHSLGAYAVDRNNADRESISMVESKFVSRGYPIMYFPEQTRIHQNVRTIDGIKKGAFTAAINNDMPIIPVGIAGFSKEKTQELVKSSMINQINYLFLEEAQDLLFILVSLYFLLKLQLNSQNNIRKK